MDEMDYIMGVLSQGGRFPERRSPILHTGDVNMKPIILNNSVIGNINQGTVNSLNASLQNITITNQVYAKDIKSFIEAVAKDKKLNREQKEDIVGKIDF